MNPIRHHTVQLRHDDIGVGSGGLVGPGLILTALHCVFPVDDDNHLPDVVPQNAPCPQARVMADFAAALGARDSAVAFDLRQIDVQKIAALDGAQFHDCTLVWPPAGAPMPKVDVALLQMSPTAMAKAPAASAPLSFRIDTVDGQELSLRGEGFPDFASIEVGANALEFREIYDLLGTTRGTQGLIRRTSKMTVLGDQPQDALEWAGLSGTLLWQCIHGQLPHLMGVVSNTSSRTRQNNALYFTCMSQLKNERSFWDVLGREIMHEEPVLNPSDRLIAFDRAIPRFSLTKWLREDLAMPAAHIKPEPDAASTSPLVVVLTGHDVDELNLFVSSAMDQMETDVGFALGSNAPTLNIRFLPGAPQEMALQTALLRWGQGLGIYEAGQVPDPNDIARALEDETRTQVVVMEHIDADFTDSCTAVMRQVLSVFNSVRPSHATSRTPPILFLAFSKGRDKEGPENGFRPGPWFDSKIDALPTLLEELKAAFPNLNWSPTLDLQVPQCAHFDMVDWLDTLEDAGLAISARTRTKIETSTRNQDTFPLFFARHLINETLSQDADE